MAKLPIAQAARIIAAGVPYGPRTHPCVCGAGRHAHSGKNLTGGCKDTGCTRYRANPAMELAYKALDAQETTLGESMRAFDRLERDRKRAANPRADGEWSIGPSDAGTCRKQIEYRNKPPEGFVPDPVDNREARVGSIIHKEVVRELAELYPWRLHEQEVRVGGLDRPAYYDEYDPITAEVHDVKTAGDWRWSQTLDYGVPVEVLKQVMLYALALIEAGHPVRTVKITYLKRDNGHDAVFVYDYDQALAEQARDELIAVATALDIGDPLPRDRSGPSTDPLCRRCFARSHCWNLVAAGEAGRSGESFTILGPEPDNTDPEVIWAVEQHVLTKEAKREAEQAAREAAALVDGLPEGRYGPYQVGSQRYGAGPRYKQFAEAVEKVRDLPEDQQPQALANLRVPHSRGEVQTTTRRVSKATLEKEARIAAKQAAREDGAA